MKKSELKSDQPPPGRFLVPVGKYLAMARERTVAQYWGQRELHLKLSAHWTQRTEQVNRTDSERLELRGESGCLRDERHRLEFHRVVPMGSERRIHTVCAMQQERKQEQQEPIRIGTELVLVRRLVLELGLRRTPDRGSAQPGKRELLELRNKKELLGHKKKEREEEEERMPERKRIVGQKRALGRRQVVARRMARDCMRAVVGRRPAQERTRAVGGRRMAQGRKKAVVARRTAQGHTKAAVERRMVQERMKAVEERRQAAEVGRPAQERTRAVGGRRMVQERKTAGQDRLVEERTMIVEELEHKQVVAGRPK